MQTLENLVDILDFKREVMNQVPVVSTLLAVLAMSVVTVLVAGAERGRLRSYLLVSLTACSLVFLFATVLDASIMPAMKRGATLHSAGQIQGLLNLSQVVVWAVLAGTVVLFGAIGALGFVYSRRIGTWTATTAGAILAVFTVCCVYLDRVMRMV